MLFFFGLHLNCSRRAALPGAPDDVTTFDKRARWLENIEWNKKVFNFSLCKGGKALMFTPSDFHCFLHSFICSTCSDLWLSVLLLQDFDRCCLGRQEGTITVVREPAHDGTVFKMYVCVCLHKGAETHRLSECLSLGTARAVG